MYFLLALLFGVAHHIWACKLRGQIAHYMADMYGLSLSWGHHIQNWLVRVLLPLVIVLSQGKNPEVLGFRLPQVSSEVFVLINMLIAVLFLSSAVIIWFAITVAKDSKVIENVKNWPRKLSWKGDLIGPLLWTIPEECFLRGYLISQFAGVNMTFALLFSTFFTAILHGSRGKFWVLLSIFTGLFFGLAFVWTGSLLTPFLMHAIDNEVFTFILALWIEKPIQEVSQN